MTPELFRKSRELFDAALELPPGERDAFVREACGGDLALLKEVEALLEEPESSTLADGVRDAIRSLGDVDAGARVGPWEIVREIGRGGMGTVHLARRADGAFDREVALKLVASGLESDRFLERFRRERQILASLTHPNIAMLLDGGTTDDGRPYFVLEYVDGWPIDEYCAKEGGSLQAKLRLFLLVCDAVQHAHLNRVVHRDLKPSNIFVTREGVPKLLDFGLARLLTPEAGTERTATQWRALTPAYASPEQVRGEPVTTASDVYSLGIVLYALLTGRKPYRTATGEPAALLHAVLTEDPVPPGAAAPQAEIPRDLDAIVLKALRKEPGERYVRAGDLARDIARFLEGQRVQATSDTFGYAARRFLSRHRREMAGGAVAAIAVTAIAFALWRSRPADDGRRAATKPPASAGAAATTALAVLPFRPLVLSEGDAVLELGMADTLITRLSGLPGITLRPVGAVLAQSRDGADALTLGRRLRVDAVVEGSLQRVSDRLRVSVRLVRVEDGHPLWGETFDTGATDVFAVEDAIAQRVAEALTPRLDPGARARLGRRGTDDLNAYNAYLKGRYFWNRRTETDFRKAIGSFRQAIAADPSYALAYSGLSDCYSLLSVWGAGPPRETLGDARAAAARAIAGDDAPGEAHASAAFVRWIYDWDWEGADQAFRRAIALNPGYATAAQWYAYYLASRGRFDEAVVQIRRAQELDPLSVSIATDVGEISCWAGRYDDAIPQLRAALEMEPNFAVAHNVLGIVHLRRGRTAEALAELERAFALDGSPRLLATLGHAYGVAGRRADARNALKRLRAFAATRYISPFQLALVHAGLGEDGDAFALLEKAREERSDNMAILRAYPLLERLRADPRFAELMARVDASSVPSVRDSSGRRASG